MAAPGMSVPGASDLSGGLGDPTDAEEERRKKLLQAQQSRLLPSLSQAPGASSLGLSMNGYGAIGGLGGV